jgi:hypothetical protein
MPKINVRENRRGNPKGTTQRHWQYWVHKTQDEDKTNEKNKTKKQSKPNHNTDIKTNDDCRNHTIKVNLLSFSYKDLSHANRLVIPVAWNSY